jgi:disulfide bond formation protein DsbB
VGALGSQYLGGLYPCEMCHWQRWPHYDAIVLAALAFLPIGTSLQRGLVLLAALAIATSGAIGAFHAGVEYGWWEGITRCSVTGSGSGDILAEIMATPLIRCDEAQWHLFGISLAGYNALFSLSGAAAIVRLCLKAR